MTDRLTAEEIAALDREFELSHNPDPVCPFCGDTMSDAWELDMRDGEIAEVECGHCEKPYQVECFVSVTYSTKPVAHPESVPEVIG